MTCLEILLEKELKIELDELQRQAVSEAVQHGVFILTGGPGTGKSTFIKKVEANIKACGALAEEFLCSSDTRSLDGIILSLNGKK